MNIRGPVGGLKEMCSFENRDCWQNAGRPSRRTSWLSWNHSKILAAVCFEAAQWDIKTWIITGIPDFAIIVWDIHALRIDFLASARRTRCQVLRCVVLARSLQTLNGRVPSKQFLVTLHLGPSRWHKGRRTLATGGVKMSAQGMLQNAFAGAANE